MPWKDILRLIKAVPLPHGKQLTQASFYKNSVKTWENAAQDLARLVFSELKTMPPSGMLKVSDWGLWGGHFYLFAYPIASPHGSFKLLDRATAPLAMVLGKPTEIIENDGIDGKLMRFGTQDTVYIPDDGLLNISETLDDQEIHGEGRIAFTTSDHALSGALCHICVQYGSKYYMLRFGSGRYPIPLLSTAVDYMNCALGGRLWQTTDWVYDYKELGHTAFEGFYGPEALEKVLSLKEAQSMEWAMRKNESFFGEGGGVFLGDVYGSSGQFMETAVGLGYISRELQRRFAHYLKG